MLPLYNYIFETISDDSILYRLGKYRISWGDPKRRKSIVDRFNIKRSDPKPGIVRWMKDDTAPIPKDSEEVIHRDSWDLEGLVGETEKQLMHPDYYKLAKHIAQHQTPKHDILTVFQCSSKKPYSENRLLKYDYFTVYDKWTDFASVSNPGTIPLEWCGFYPYRYDEWNLITELRVKDFVDLDRKDEIVNICRFLKYQRKMKYKHVLVVIGNPAEQSLFDLMWKHNIENARDWLHIVTDDSFRNNLSKKPKYAKLFNTPGLVSTRIPGLPDTRKSYERALRKCLEGDRLKEFNDAVKAHDEKIDKNKSKTNEALGGQEWSVLKNVSTDEIIKTFKEYTKDNKGFKNNDKPILYRKYYFSVLDILIVGLQGRLVEDIDDLYWRLTDALKKDSDFECFGKEFNSFLFAYKPLCDQDKIKMKDMNDESLKLYIVLDEKNYELPEKVLKQLK